MKLDFGRWGVCECERPELVRVICAACGADDHRGHFLCSPGWEEAVRQAGGRVIAGPCLPDDAGWQALVEFPNAAVVFGWEPEFGPVLPDDVSPLLVPDRDWEEVARVWRLGLQAGLDQHQLDGLVKVTILDLGYNIPVEEAAPAASAASAGPVELEEFVEEV